MLRRIFYSVEELLELHLAILEGVQDRFETPFFDNLKKYAQRPIGTFHALPIARGKSVFKSDWIRDMGEFYGMNLFLAESSATTGGLDSLLEPTGNIKKSAGKGGEGVWRRPRVLRHQRNLDIEQDGGAGAGRSRRHRDRRPQLPQIASLRNGAGGRPAALRRGVSDDGILDVRRGAAENHQAGAAQPEEREQAASGQDDRPDELHVRRPHLQHAPGDGGMSRHQAGPDLPVGRSLVRLRAIFTVPAAAHRDGRRQRHRSLDARSKIRPGVREAARRTRRQSVRRPAPEDAADPRSAGRAAARLPHPFHAQIDVGAAAGIDADSSRTSNSTPWSSNSRKRCLPTPRPVPTSN